MITSIRARNLAVISSLDIELGKGLNILTGETGAGKTIIIDAVSLALGARADSSMVRSGEERAVIEVLFEMDPGSEPGRALREMGIEHDGQMLVRREISASGSSARARINGQLATLEMLRNAGRALLAVHGQNEHQSMGRPETRRMILDRYAGCEELAGRVRETWLKWRELAGRLEKLRDDESRLLQQKDFLKHQLEELQSASVNPGELEELDKRRGILRHLAKLGELIEGIRELFEDEADDHGVADMLGQASSMMDEYAAIDENADELAERLRSAVVEIQDIGTSVSSLAHGLHADPGELELVEERIALIRNLERKYGCDSSGLATVEKKLQGEFEILSDSREIEADLENEMEEVKKTLGVMVADLSSRREKAGKKMASQVETILADLGMPQCSFAVKFDRKDDEKGIELAGRLVAVGAHGAEQVEFLVSPNQGEIPGPVARIASGGELSRIMLALKKVAARADNVPTLIFDEIDAGIGGKTATAVARQLESIAHSHQVICITHLPVIAGAADIHFTVEKKVKSGRTEVKVRLLDHESKKSELARMIAGEKITEAVLKHAEELLSRKSS